jgi:hypothetical protein
MPAPFLGHGEADIAAGSLAAALIRARGVTDPAEAVGIYLDVRTALWAEHHVRQKAADATRAPVVGLDKW